MKLRIKIIGHRVHDVGYRVFLLKHAMNLALPGLSTYNWNENGQQEVIVLVEGDEARIAAFREKIEKEMPQLAEVSKITFEDYAGEVGRTGEVAMFCSFVQLDKAIPLLLEMKDDLKCLVTGQNEMKDDLKCLVTGQNEMKDDLKCLVTGQNEMKDDLKCLVIGQNEMKDDLKCLVTGQNEVVDETKGLREDMAMRDNVEWQARVEKDIRIIKSKLGIR